MTTGIGSLRSWLAGISGAQYTLTATSLGTPALTGLFTAFIPGQGLVIDNPAGDATALTLGGKATLGSATAVPVVVTFLPDGPGAVLAGLSIAFDLASFSFTATWASFSGTALDGFGCTNPRLVLAAGSATDDGSPQAAVEGTKAFETAAGTSTATLRAEIPAADLVAAGLTGTR